MHVYHSVVVFWYCESDRHRPTLVTCLPWCAWPSSWPGRPCWAAGEARKTSRCPSRAGSSRWRGSRPLCGQIISQERHPPLIFNISIERSENPSIELVHCNWLLNYWNYLLSIWCQYATDNATDIISQRIHRHYVHGRWLRHVDQTDINMVWLSNMSNIIYH